MNKLLKIFGYIIISLFLLIIILAVTASLSQKRIVDIALKKLSESITVPVEIEDLSFTLIKRFPYATVELSGVKIGAAGSNLTNSVNQLNEDIIKIKSVYISVKTKPLIKGEFEIIKVEIEDAFLNYKVDSLGFNNISFLMDSNINAKNKSISDTGQNRLANMPTLYLKKVKLKNIAIYYADDTAQISANLFIPSLDIEGQIADKQYAGIVEGNLRLTECNFGDTNLKRMEDATFDFKLDYNADTLQIKSFEANTSGAHLGITGKVAFTKKIFSDLTFVSTELDLGKLLKYTPDELLNEYGVEDIKGTMIVSGSIKGNVKDSIRPAVDLAVDFNKGVVKIKDYPTVKKINFKGTISNGTERNNKTTRAIFNSFHAETDSSKVDLSLTLSNLDKAKYTLNSKLNIYIEEFKDFIPDSLIQNISGELIADLSTKGQLPDSIDNDFINLVANNSSVNAEFKNVNITMDSLIVKDFSGSANYAPGQLNMDSITVLIPAWSLNLKNTSFNSEFTGELTQPQHLGINFKYFYAELPQGNVWGSADIRNLEQPDFDLKTNALINLSELKPFIPDTLLKNLSGSLEAKIRSHGKLNFDSIADQVNDIIFKQSDFEFDAKNVSVTMPDTPQKLTDLNGALKMGHDTIFISKMNGIAGGIDFSIDSTTIVNVYNAVIQNQYETVFADGNLEFGAIDYSKLAPFFPADSSGNEIKTRNYLFEARGKIAAKSFKHEKILMNDISAKFNVSDSVYIIDQFKANAFDGSTNSSVKLSIAGKNKQIINIKTHIERMDIKKFLYAFNNFGQDSIISYENISGLFSTDLNSQFVFDADTLVTRDMRTMGNLTLKNGRIINYKPAMEIANFTGLKELDNIDLKTVSCNIFLFKNNLYVPITDIVSTSMDFSTFGMQSFGNDYEYHLRMKLGDVLKGKSKKLIERQYSSGDEVSEEDIDRNTIKIIYANIDGKKKTGFDTKKLQKKMELKIQVQQKMLDLIFHPKLVSFETGVQ